MKIFILFFLFGSSLLLSQPSQAQHKTDKDLTDLQGPVHIVRTKTSFERKTGKTIKKGFVSEYTETYDRQGNLVEKHSAFGQMSASKSVFHRDEDGNRIEKTTILPAPPNPNMPPPPPPPAPAGADADILEFKTTYKFEPEKKRLEAVTYRASGELLKTEVYLFDDKGRVIELTRKNGPTIPFGSQSQMEYKRDAKGVVTESISYGKDGTVERRTRYQYVFDKHGNWIRKTESRLDKDNKPLLEQFTTERTITYY